MDELPPPVRLTWAAVHKAIKDILDAHHTAFREVRHNEFPVSVKSPADVARALACPVEQIAKTLLLYAGRPCFAVLSSNKRLQFNAISDALGSRCRAATREEMKQWIEYPPGSVSPLGVPDLPVFIDAALQQFEKVLVGGGEAGSEIELSLSDFTKLTGAITLTLT